MDTLDMTNEIKKSANSSGCI